MLGGDRQSCGLFAEFPIQLLILPNCITQIVPGGGGLTGGAERMPILHVPGQPADSVRGVVHISGLKEVAVHLMLD